MAFLDTKEICEAYEQATKEALIWREDYPEYERLMNNGLLEALDENLPEVNDGSLAASLFKLAKRVLRKNMGGRAVTLDDDDAWKTELANIMWEKRILKNARSQASPRRKWKDGVRKSAGYGGQPIITLFVERGKHTGADFIVPYALDVKLEAGKVSDEDSDIIFWDVYYTKLQVRNMIEQAEAEMKQAKESDENAYNKWDIACLKEILESNEEVERPGNEENSDVSDKGVIRKGYHFYIAFQRGENAPFTMMHTKKKTPVREWSNPDPTGDTPVHYLYCYQDFVNPYGVGIVQLAGGTQNVLDYFRQADVLATQIGIRRPRIVSGQTDEIDFDSLTYTEDAIWDIGNAKLDMVDMADGVYRELPGRISQYQTSLQKIIPMGDTSASASDSGDPMQSKTPAGVKLQAANLSIDDDDFMENVDECYAVVAQSMINTHFANMQGNDLLKLTADEQQILEKAGIEFPVGEDGQPSRELDIAWDEARATFEFEVDPEADKTTDDAQQLEGLTGVTEFLSNPNTQALLAQAATGQPLMLGSKKIDLGELIGTIVALSTDNDKIVTEVSPEELQEAQMMAQQQAMAGQVDPATGMPMEDSMMEQPAVEGEVMPQLGMEGMEGQQPEISDQEAEANLMAVMEQYNVDQETAAAMLEAERQGWSDEEIADAFLAEEQPYVQ